MKPIDKFIRTYQSVIVSVSFCVLSYWYGVWRGPFLLKVQELAGKFVKYQDKQQGCRKT